MESLLGVPIELVSAGSLGACLLSLLILASLAVRRPLLARLALRNPRRRPTQAMLITLGLTLSTLIIATALNTGDAISYTVRSLVASGLGRADEVVVALPREQRRNPGEMLGALINGSLLTGLGSYYSQDRAEALVAGLRDDPRVAGIAPAIAEHVTVVNRDLQAVQGQVSLLALPVDYPPALGSLDSTDGRAVGLVELNAGELLVNAAAANQLGAIEGTALDLRTRDGVRQFVVRAIVWGGDLGGAQPTLYLPLELYQQLVNRPRQVNQVLIANRGSATDSVRLSSEVAREARLVLADRRAAAALFDLLRSESARGEIANAALSADGRLRTKLEALRRTLELDAANDDFVSLVTDVDIERRLLQMASRLAGPNIFATSFPELSPLRVLEVKQAAQDQADRWGGALTAAFLTLGLFSLATGALLVFLIFVMLAAERRTELGVARALGARRFDVIVAFLLEGGLYDLLGSAVGLVLGVLAALAICAAGNSALAVYGLQIAPRVEPRTMLLAYCLGLLLTLLTVGSSAWHISRLSVVTAMRDLPDPPASSRRRMFWLRGPLLALAGLALAWHGLARAQPVSQALGVFLLVAGLAVALRRGLTRLGLASGLAERAAYTAGGGVLLGYWLLPIDGPALGWIRPAPRSIDFFFLAGISMVVGAVWVVLYNLPQLLSPIIVLSARWRGLGVAMRTAAAHPLQHRSRTGLALAMFALIMFSMVVAGVLLSATHRAYSDPEALNGGFDVRVDLLASGRGVSLPDDLSTATAVRADDFVGGGRVATRPGQVVQLGPGERRWRAYSLQEVDAAFVAGLRAPLAARAAGYGSDGQAWSAILQRPGFAMVAGSAVASRQADSAGTTGFRFSDLVQEQVRFDPVEVWVRDERGGQAVKLTVIGVLDSRVSFGAGLYTAAATFEQAAAKPPQRISYYLRSRDGADPAALSLGLNLSFGDRGVRATALGEEVRRVQSVRALLNQLLQSFFGVGLLGGLAALGVISLRAVVERRQQIGVLRALGFKRQLVRLSLLLEVSLLALTGLGLGVVLGLALSQRLVEYLGRQYPEISFGIPWEQIGFIALGAYASAVLLAAIPLWQIGRITPAEALKYE